MRFARDYVLAGNPKTAARTLRRLASVGDAKVRCRLAENVNTPADVLQMLCVDSHPDVRAALVFNSAVNSDILRELCLDADVNVRLSMAERLELPEPVLALLLEDENPYVRDCAERTHEIRTLEARLTAESFVAERGEDARLGELLCSAGWLEQQHLSRLVSISECERIPLGQVILRETDLSHEVVVAALNMQLAIRRGRLAIAEAVNNLRNRYPIRIDSACYSAGSVNEHLEETGSIRRSQPSLLEVPPSSGSRKVDLNPDERMQWRMWQSSQHGIAQVLSDANSLADAAPRLLQMICETTGWDVGIMWEVNPSDSRLSFVDLWHISTVSVHNFEQICRRSSFELGMGLPGRVWKTGKGAWIPDTSLESDFPRFPQAEQDGLRCGFAYPIHIQGDVVAVIEFFSRQERQADDYMAILDAAAGLIGQYLERREAEIRLRKFHAIIASVGCALVQAATMRELLQSCAQAIVTHLDAAFARIWTLDEVSDSLVLQASAGLYTHIDGGHQRIRVGQYKVGLIASEQKPHLTNDVQSDPRVGDKEWAKREGLVAFAGYPLLVDSKLVGVMTLFARHSLNQGTLDALGSIADHVALGIARKFNEKAQRRLASIVESSEDAIISADIDGLITHCNCAAERLCGYPVSELTGKPISLLLPWHDSYKLLEDLDKLTSGAHVKHYETSINRKDGTLLDVSLTLSSIKDSLGNISGIAVFARDISQRKRSEMLLAMQYTITRILAESASLDDAVPKVLETIAKGFHWQWGAFLAVEEHKQHLRCRFVWNDGGAKLSEFASVTTYMTVPYGIGISGQTYSECRSIWAPNFSENESYPRSGVACKAGLHAAVTFPIALGSRVLAVLEFFSEYIGQPDNELLDMMSSIGMLLAQFMERKAAEEKARIAVQSEQRIAQDVINLAPAAIARLDKNLVITSMNSQFSEYFAGESPHSNRLLEKFVFQVLSDLPAEKLIDTVEKKVPFCMNNYRMKLHKEQHSKCRFWDLAGWPLGTDEGGMILMATEVTDRVNLAQQRDDFVATLTHDLKNPLIGSIRILSFLLDEKTGIKDENLVTLLSSLAHSNQHMLDLISDLLEVYRYEAGQEQLQFLPVDLKALVEELTRHLLATSIVSHVHLKSVFPQDDNTIMADSKSMQRVLANLLSNALKFTDDGGEVVVSGDRFGDEYILEVKDTGTGISEKERKQLFERFSQGASGRKHQSGTGLGLYLSRQIVERHAGTITCESEVGLGTVFRICLPTRQNLQQESL